MTEPAQALPADDGNAHWQPLPGRARRLFVANGLASGLALALAPAVLAGLFDLAPPWRLALAGALLGAPLGAWLGHKRWKHTHWRLDDDGFNLRRGRLWRSETRVPASRVQHLDLKRGPLQRRYGLATLVIHTAGTRHSAVAVGGLDAGDAEHLRDRLAHQPDDDADDA